ncbi:MAG: phosphodiester glycosidase family protein [Notoacmeibacter sp.]|nr:phosphodiester glycosidase family protein [Notoacmeibacter sp.]MCC0032952.1 phosphodiester glycosidase family protein [Brucellaceae bacterium]
MVTLTVLAAAVAGAAWFSWTLRREESMIEDKPVLPEELALPDICRQVLHEGTAYFACAIDPARFAIRLVHSAPDGTPYGSLAGFLAAEASAGKAPLIAMNAGMYHEDLSPVGLHVEEGREVAALNMEDAPGNFFLKPNGVFFITVEGKAGVMESAAFHDARVAVRLATQSGPMLVIGGALHPKFLPDGTSRYIRNGVGVTPDGTVVLAISRSPVSLGAFARAFRDGFGCPDALFLDGGISAFAANSKLLIGGQDKAGPILAVSGG